MDFEFTNFSLLSNSKKHLGDALCILCQGKPLFELVYFHEKSLNDSFCVESFSSFSSVENIYDPFMGIIVAFANALCGNGIAYIRGKNYSIGENGAAYYDGTHIYINNGENSKKRVYVLQNEQWKERKVLPTERSLVDAITEDSFSESLIERYKALRKEKSEENSDESNYEKAFSYQKNRIEEEERRREEESRQYYEKLYNEQRQETIEYINTNKTIISNASVPKDYVIAGKSFCLLEAYYRHIKYYEDEIMIRGGYANSGRYIHIHSDNEISYPFEDYYVLSGNCSINDSRYIISSDYRPDFKIINEFQLCKMLDLEPPLTEKEYNTLNKLAMERVNKIENEHPDLMSEYIEKTKREYLQRIHIWKQNSFNIKDYILNSNNYNDFRSMIDYDASVQIKGKKFCISGGETYIDREIVKLAIEEQGGEYSSRMIKAADYIVELGYRSAKGLDEKRLKGWKFRYITDVQFWRAYQGDTSEEALLKSYYWTCVRNKDMTEIPQVE